MHLRRSLLPALALLAAMPVAAQFGSEGYKFLQAIRESKRDDVIAAVNRPGSQIVNTRDRSTGETALHITVRRGDQLYTNYLLANGADPNVRDGHGITPMLAAIQEGHGDLVPLLLAGRANPNLASTSGVTPIILATQLRQVETVRALIVGRANPDQKDYNGMSARDYATHDPRATAIVRLFAETPPVARAPVAGPRL